jgi:hypothetical protein
MAILLEIRLREAARRAGRRLRGFDDPAFHTGSPESFYRQFRRVLEVPAIRVPKWGLISFADAMEVCRLDDPGASPGEELADELAGLLGGPAVNDAGERQPAARQSVSEDVNRMLGIPAMRFYFRTEYGPAFGDGVRRLADRVFSPIRIGPEQIREGPEEQFRIMEPGSTVSCWVSYAMLRLVTGQVPISAYQAEDYVTAT